MPERGPGGTFLSSLACSNEERLALQYAFYNTLFLVLLALSLCGLLALYNMLYMFVSPMIWAVLVGTVLFPFKRKVTDVVKTWLASLQETETTLAIGVIGLPFSIFLYISNLIYTTMVSQLGVTISGAYVLLKVLSYDRTFMYLISWLGRVYESVDSFIIFFTRSWVFPIIIVYFCAYSAWIYVQEPAAINKKIARTLSLPIWIYLLSFISMYFGPFRAFVFGVAGIILALLSAGVVGVEDSPTGTVPDDEQQSGENQNYIQSDENLDNQLKHISSGSEMNEPAVDDTIDEALSGDRLIRCVTALCALLWIVRHDSALLLLSIPFLFALCNRVANGIGLTSSLCGFISSSWESVYPSVQKLVHISVAGPLRQFVKVLFTSDQFVVSSLHAHMDVLSSIVVMLLLALSALLAVFFVGFQLHEETVHLARLTSNVISSRPDWLGAALNYTEDQLEDHNIDIDNYIEQAYQQGRTWLATTARSLSDGKDTARADMLETQVKQIVDNIYRMWEERNAAVQGGSTTSMTRGGDWWTQLQGITDLHALKKEITLIIRENIDSLMGIAQSLWSIIAMNLSFLSSVLAACAGVILGFGMDIANFLIEVIVFLTMVYYLLSGSTDRWLPLEWISRLVDVSKSASKTEYNVTPAVEQAISGVFVLSIKMAVFYGLYTYFVHSLFDLNIVFLPSLLASMFAAIPIMAPYFVSVFGLFELWLVRGESSAALIFGLMSVAPIMFADAAFYKEVKGSHPYVTGLAVIGGMYWLGLQGAIIGPIVLCTFLVVVNMYLQFMKSANGANIIVVEKDH